MEKILEEILADINLSEEKFIEICEKNKDDEIFSDIIT
jgi:hypothetical protein